MTCSHAFSRAWRRLHVFVSNFDWFIALFKSVVIGQTNRPFPSCFEPHYESEAKFKVYVMKISFHSYANKTNFNMKSFALRFALRDRSFFMSMGGLVGFRGGGGGTRKKMALKGGGGYQKK